MEKENPKEMEHEVNKVENEEEDNKSMVSEEPKPEIKNEKMKEHPLLGLLQSPPEFHSHSHHSHQRGMSQIDFKPHPMIMGLKNPADISDVPKSFFEREDMQGSPILSDKEELVHFRCIIACFFNYKIDSYRNLARMMRDLSMIGEKYRDIIKEDIEKRRQKLELCIQQNSLFLCKIVTSHKDLFTWKELKTGDKFLEPFYIESKNVSKLRSTLRQIRREWSSEGKWERDQSFKPILEALEQEWPLDNKEIKREEINVLCPGSGLGRLPFEISSLGFSSQGNEFSYHMLLTSNFILNETYKKNMYTIYPGIHDFCNSISEANNFKGVEFPDVNPWEKISKKVNFSMAAGEFIKVYSNDEEKWDAVVTCFFIDTAHNVLEYIELISKMLKKGGVWINLGPLLWHYSDNPMEVSVELTWEQVKKIILMSGLEFEKEDFFECNYCSDKEKLMKTTYKSIFFKVRKPK